MTEASLKQAIDDAVSAGDMTAIEAARRAYVERHPDGDAAADTRFRLGLTLLLTGGDLDEATQLFKDAAAEKSAPISAEARISYALCLNAKKKRQQAIFELRKLLPARATPTPTTAKALEYLSTFLREAGDKNADLDKVDEQRQEHLTTLADDEADPEQKGSYLLRLAAAYVDTGRGPDRTKAQRVLNDVLKLGPKAATSVKSARAELKALAQRR